MMDPRHVAERIVGRVEWRNEVSGFCRCPGEGMHTSSNGKRDCRVNIDGAPTIFCFHASCVGAVAEANRKLRRELNASPWELRLPDGRTLRSGDVLVRDGTVVRREVLGDAGNGRWQMANGKEGPSFAGGYGGQAGQAERVILETLRVNAERFRGDLFEFFRWPMGQILEDSPLLVAERDPEDQFRTWLKLWPACSTVWIGDDPQS